MRYIIFIVSISILDLFSKYVIKNKVPVNTKIEILKDKLYIWHIKNKGTAYSKFEKYPDFVFISSGILLSTITVYFIKLLKKEGQTFLKTGMAMIIGGAIGNIIERGTKREVTDFIYIKTKNAPIFNIADVFIFIGSGISMLSSIFSKK